MAIGEWPGDAASTAVLQVDLSANDNLMAETWTPSS